MNTTVQEMSREEHRRLCGLVAALIPSLKWRHNGLGLLQAYVQEGTEQELRVHIWHHSLKRPGIEESGLIHDHRFHLTSQILCGALRQDEYALRWEKEGAWQAHAVVHAREAMAKHRINDGDVQTLPDRYHATISSTEIYVGQTYAFPKREFHSTNVLTPIVVTLVTKTAQENFPARILAPFDKPVVHAFADPLPESTWEAPLKEARDVLQKSWSTSQGFFDHHSYR